MDTYNTIINDNDKKIIHINEHVLQVFTSFSKGAVHGFSGFYYTLIEYITNFNKYKDLKILLFKDSQSGMLDIINFCCEKKIIDKNKIIYIEKNRYYEFLSVTFIPNCFHVFNEELIPVVDNFINKNLIIDSKLNIKENVCLLKTDTTINLNQIDFYPSKVVEEFSKKYNFDIINTNNEIELINNIYNCTMVILSYGSCFFKNFIYISEKCKKVIIMVKGAYIADYYRLSTTKNPYQGLILKKYKNADFIYIIANDNELNFNPYEK